MCQLSSWFCLTGAWAVEGQWHALPERQVTWQQSGDLESIVPSWVAGNSLHSSWLYTTPKPELETRMQGWGWAEMLEDSLRCINDDAKLGWNFGDLVIWTWMARPDWINQRQRGSSGSLSERTLDIQRAHGIRTESMSLSTAQCPPRWLDPVANIASTGVCVCVCNICPGVPVCLYVYCVPDCLHIVDENNSCSKERKR